jgi:hypothetical protein
MRNTDLQSIGFSSVLMLFSGERSQIGVTMPKDVFAIDPVTPYLEGKCVPRDIVGVREVWLPHRANRQCVRING